ncbi:septal ring lytic transglycosylase RlpA family protein [Hyphomicrobium sp. LHD-15]|uniref:septal ring lytic transglycosylase RlpA family protein n=1 Tax=Hyphomicrobium sp. LHD-15 TaxID=3072142 RepID=UPI00280D8A2A|nr:septal ring lytic transglycosylase RlpA family protein [Hyphomicrobium sp. LHD-15]MDQ8697311.1 septal ring lytic transglycosylase RlpA family protein [Hyphomicrobium sp. LHD-15]
MKTARYALSSLTFALAAGSIGLSALASLAFAKAPGATYCYNGVCHRVKTLAEMDTLVGYEEVVTASYYDDCKVDKHNPCTALSSGEDFRADLPDNAASPVYPNGTILVLRNPKTESTALVRVNNSGPYKKGRMLDVSRAAAEQLGFIKQGTARLNVTVISGPLSK